MIGDPGNPVNYRYPTGYGYRPNYIWNAKPRFDLFWLVFPTFGPMTAALVQQQVVQIPNESDFECRQILYHASNANAQLTQTTAIIPNITVMLTAAGTSRQMMNAPVTLASFACAESDPHRDLPWPMYFNRNDTLTCILTNFDAAVIANQIRITLVGRKVFDARPV